MMRSRRMAVCAAVVFALFLGQSAPGMTNVADKIVDALANATVSAIQNASCAQLAAEMESHKSGGGRKSSEATLESDRAARQRFVNKVAGPLINKLIDCNMLPH